MPPRAAVALMDCRERDQAAHFAHPWHRLQTVEGGGVLVPSGLHDLPCQGRQQTVRGSNPGEVHCEACVHSGGRNACSHPLTVGCVGALRAALGPVVLAVGVWDMCQACGPLAQEKQAPPPEVARGPPLRRRDRGLGEHATTEHHGALVRIDPVVCGLAAVQRLHGEGVSEHKGHMLTGTHVREPLPGEHACDGDDNIVPIGRDGFEPGVGLGWHRPVQPNLAVLTQDTDIHGAGSQVDATIKWMLFGVQSHEVSSSCE